MVERQWHTTTALFFMNVTTKGDDLLYIDIAINECPCLHICVCIRHYMYFKHL